MPEQENTTLALLRGRIDVPADGASVRRRRVQFRGWALAGTDAPASVDVVLNGRRRVPAELGHDRPDVRESLNERRTELRCGWVAEVDLAGEAIGSLHVAVEARAGSGEHEVIAEQVLRVADDLIGHVERPADGAIVDDGLLVVNGWNSYGIGYARVEVTIDGSTVGRARTFIVPARPAEKGNILEPSAGFEGRFPVEGRLFDGASHEIAVTAWNLEGKKVELATREVTFQPSRVRDRDAELAALLRRRTSEVLASYGPPSAAHGHLLVFAHDFDLGGAELYLQDLLGQLMPRLESCTVVSPRDGTLAAELRSIGVDVVIRGETAPAGIAEYEGEIRQLESLVRTSGCGVALVNSLANATCADAAIRAGVPIVWAIHESFDIAEWVAERYEKGLRPYARERIGASLRSASHLVFVAEASRAKYLPLGIDPAASTVLSYGVDSRAIDEYQGQFDRRSARAEQGIAEDALVFVCVALFAELKAQALLVEAFARARTAHPDAVLVLVGDRNIPYADAVRAAVERADTDHVKVVPATADTWYWFGLADVCVISSDIESMPRSILEAMSFGLPVLATKVVGVPEVVRDGENGWLTEPNDLRSMIAALDRAMSTPAWERSALGAAAREMITRERKFEVLGEAFSRLIDRFETGAGRGDRVERAASV
jgi:glycosyltransferase involved in cell wall biosynthesis